MPPVTEFALIHLLPNPSPHTTDNTNQNTTTTAATTTPIPPNFLSALASAMRDQDTWHAAAFPSLPSSAAARAAVWFRQVEDPAWLLTTARWESVAAHWDWIRSEENQRVMGGLEEGIVPGDTVLFHVVGGLFGGEDRGGGEGGGLGSLLESAVISVGRMFVKRAERGGFEAKFEEVRGILEEYARPHLVRFGWREDVEEGAEEEEFVVVCGWDSVEQHFAFAETEEFARYGELRELIARVDLKHYKPLPLE
ncbi:hypothetical protein F5144DRAFT_601667 [Chaetomium tenue]|uniref:Uncharacterized protein n=1 Tax=Chaetomium tenue TaxID=1854479 RepID=A0ACB7PDW3_9PEZI|nr:hypothetical protein F5144DRAFT_601667 [Chaetomium globosum]